MATLVPQTPSLTDADLAFVAAAVGGDQFPNTGKEFAIVKNGSGAPIDVTFDSPGTCSFGLSANAAHDKVASVAAGATEVVGPFPTTRFSDSNGSVQVTYSGVTSLTIVIVRP